MAETLHSPNHNHPEHEPVITKRWKWLTVLGNAAIGAAELVTGNVSTLSVASDGLHNVGDTATYYMQAENILNPNLTEQRRKRMRKIAHWAIALTSLGVSAKAGVDLVSDQEHVPNPSTIYAAYASLALNGLMLARLQRGMRRKKSQHTEYEHDIAKHFWAVDIPSAGLAVAGAALQKYNVDIEQTAAIASGLVGAYAFRPTEKNLAHNCLDHDHGHGHGHGHHVEHVKQKGWLSRWVESRRSSERPSRFKMAVGLGAAALALVGGLITGDSKQEHTVSAAPDTGGEPSVTHVMPELPQPPANNYAAAMECATVQPGDSQWGMISQRLESATNQLPSDAATNAITMYTVLHNKATAPEPDILEPGECLEIPTETSVRILHNAFEQNNSQLGTELHSLNRYASVEQVMQQDATMSQIDLQLQSALTS